MIDGYTHNNTLTSGDSVPLGTQLILVCRVVGLPYGTPFSYTWTCPNGDCELVRFDRKIYKNYILAVNTTDVTYGGTYICQVTATGGQEASGSFTLSVTGTSCSEPLWRVYRIRISHHPHLRMYTQVVVLSTVRGDSYLMSFP